MQTIPQEGAGHCLLLQQRKLLTCKSPGTSNNRDVDVRKYLGYPFWQKIVRLLSDRELIRVLMDVTIWYCHCHSSPNCTVT
jgi:hypothetical protein